ncbi:hypothetical protein GCM10023069_22210 [Shinella granuli]
MVATIESRIFTRSTSQANSSPVIDVFGGISSADIGPIDRGEAAPGETGVARPCFDKPGISALRMGAQEGQPVRFRAVERHHEQDAMIKGSVPAGGGMTL